RLKDRHWNTITQEFEDIEFDQVYELHKVDTTKLMDDADDDNDEAVYSIKCWCTSTDEVHWLWVDSEVAGSEDPLEAIASTCMIYESMSGRIKHIIRQGDVFLFEMLDENYMPNEDEVKVPMKAKEYFRLLKSQS
ncbi:MAG: hypothetical protein KAH32_07360, partial [Chlamydiia bacterium]|nr:hypothetical protein [Chlamydiia bacterium]